MAFWDWLWGKKSGDDGLPVHVSPPLPAGMQQLQLSAPAAVPSNYGIQRAIELMRALPVDDDPALVLRVVRKTLSSMGVSLEEIISSAKTRESAVVSGIESDRTAIEQLEIQIATRRANIARLEMDLDETRSVRSRLEEAQETETKVGPAAAFPPRPPPAKPETPAPPASQPSNVAKPGPAPLPKRAPPAVPVKPPPKLPSAVSQAPAKTAAPASAPKPAPSDARKEPTSSLPDIGEIDDAFNEPTAKREINVTDMGGDRED